MQFKILNHTSKSFSIVELSQPQDDGTEEKIVFDTSGYSSTTPGAIFTQPDGTEQVELFNELNEFIELNLSLDEQERLFTIYERINNLFNDDVDYRRKGGGGGVKFDSILSRLCCEIYEVVDFRKLLEFVKIKVEANALRIPGDIHPRHMTEDRLTPRYVDCTYLTPEYHELVAMCLGLRLMIPVWGRYMPLKRHDDQSSMKEYHSYQLIVGSRFHRAPCFSRLERYVRGSMDEKDDLGVILAGLSNEEIPIFLMAISTVRKLSVASLSADDDRKHLIRMLYHYVKNKAINLSKSLGHNVRAKIPQGEDRDSEDNSSVIDIYKMREEVPVGDLAVIESYITNFVDENLSLYDKKMSPERVEECMSILRENRNFNPTNFQIILTTLIVSTLVPGNTVELFEEDVLKKTFAIAQSVLWTWGMHELAIILTANALPLEKGERYARTFRRPMSEDRLEKLDEVYPHPLNINEREEYGNITNVGVKSIEMISSLAYGNDWEVNCPKDLAQHFENSDIISIFEASPDMRNQLADVLIRLSEVY